jgi:transglutaminase-like putative cysteine protease
MLRVAGIPARYVSGYVCPLNEGMRGVGATHAWVEAYIPGHGWLGIDPTNNSIVNEQHVRLAFGRSFADCTPVKGTYKGSSEHTLNVSVRIENDSTGKSVPVFTTTFRKEEPSSNSYRRYLEFQQQQ